MGERPGGCAARRLLGKLELAFDEVVELAYRRLVGIKRHGPVRAVEKNDFAGLYAGGDVDESRHSRNGEGAREKRDMARGGSAVCGETEHELARKLDGLGGGEIVCYDDRRRAQLDVGSGREAGE